MKASIKGFIAPLLLVLIALFLAGGGAYVYQQTKQTNQSAIVASTTQATDTVIGRKCGGGVMGNGGACPAGYTCKIEKIGPPSEGTCQTSSTTQTPDSQIADWKTYTNTQYGFEIKYPKTYTEDISITQYGVETISFSDKNDKTDLNPNFQIAIDSDINAFADPLTVLKFQPEKIVSGPMRFVVGNITVDKYRIRWNYQGKEYINNFAVLKLSDRIYTFSDLKSDEATFNLTLSTFKFIK